MKNTDVALVIFQAKAAISKACDGRACLPECLRAIERAASVETAAAPLFASGAKAAKRTPAEDAPPHGARLRVPVGAVRPAWRAFASFSRRARGLFRRIWRGLAARLPAGARLARNAIAAVAITLGVTCPFLRADVFCIWNGTEYICSGEGSAVRVVGGGDGWQGDIIVTNIVGVCTNCVAMSPDYVRQFKQDVLHDIEIIKVGDDTSAGSIFGIQSAALDLISALEAYTNTIPNNLVPPAERNDITNLFHSVGPYYGVPPQNKAAQLVSEIYPDVDNRAQPLNYRLNLYYGAAYAYNEFATTATSAIRNAQKIYDDSELLDNRLDALSIKVGQGLIDDECTAQWDGPSTGGSGSGGGSSVVTNQVSGNWCTYDQGQAIKELLSDIKKWEKDQVSYLTAVSNYLKGIDFSIKSALFSRYTNIPSESNMGETWQDVYLAGQPTRWGYEPTNILQRIELLVYGMSGVGTNTTDVAEATGVDPDEAETAGDDAKNAIDELSVGDSAASADVRSIMDALTSFFRTFNGLTGDRFSGQTAIGSYSVEIGEQRYDVPALVVDSGSANMANVVQSACRAFLTCAYLLFAVFCGWRFYVLFLGAAVKYAKWAQELLSSLFAD